MKKTCDSDIELTPSDRDCQDFLRCLDDAPFECTDWEAEFLETNLGRTTFTPAQRQSIERMMNKYPGLWQNWKQHHGRA